MILDCRRANVYFREPPSVELLTSEGLGRIEVVESGANDLGELSSLSGERGRGSEFEVRCESISAGPQSKLDT